MMEGGLDTPHLPCRKC